MASAAMVAERPVRLAPHPNEIDRRRILRALEKRVRYRYVTPSVEQVEGGYLISSPCCSRNIDPEGGVIDIARLEYVPASGHWRLYRKDHEHDNWSEYGIFINLEPLLALLQEDPERCFWQ